MSVVPSSSSPTVYSADVSPVSASAELLLHVRLDVERQMLAGVVAEVIRLADRFLPDVSHFLVADGASVTLCVKQGTIIRVCQTDRLVCRLARVRGVRYVEAKQTTGANATSYGAALRGRDWSGIQKA